MLNDLKNDQTILAEDIRMVVCEFLKTNQQRYDDTPENHQAHNRFHSKETLSVFIMATLARLNGVSEALPLASGQSVRKRVKLVGCISKKTEGTVEEAGSVQATRRAATLGLASVALTMTSGIGVSLADDNGWWLTTPLPVPTVENVELANKETGTRSFLKRQIYMANIGASGSAYRIRKYAFDLLCLGDLIGKDAWNYVNRYLRLKSTFMYYDFDKVISAASTDDKKPLLDLANRLFDGVEKLEASVEQHDLPQTEADYRNISVILEEVMVRMA